MKLFSFKFLFFLVLFFIFPCSVLASVDQFRTAYDIVYNVDSTGGTTVKQVVKLTNVKEHVYATQYNIVIGSTQISNVSASDNFGTLTPKIEDMGNSMNIILPFEEKMVGEGKTRTITLIYKTNDFATVRGKVLDIGLPILADPTRFEEYKITLNIPSYFGKATQISNDSYEFAASGSIFSYIFDGRYLPENKGITATFGSEQLLDFVLRYNIANEHDVRARTEIALPPDTTHQRVIYEKIEPEPENVEVDFDGNWLAKYVMEPKEELEIKAYGSVLIKLDYDGSFSDEPSEIELQNWTKPDTYWESGNKEVEDLAESLGTVEAVYDYVVNNFEYDYDRLNEELVRMGARKALSNMDSAVCMEFADTFIALTRALGIPAREHNGFAFAENERLRPIIKDQDVLHSWAEYWDNEKKEWVQVDPTWGNTTGGLDYFNKFDLDHFTSVIHGLESDYPVTVASYKTDKTVGKDIEVSFGTNFEPTEEVAYEILAADEGKTGIPYKAKVLVFNTGTAAVYDVDVDAGIWSGQTKIVDSDMVIETIPPLGYVEVPIEYMTDWKDLGGNYKIAVSGMGKASEQEMVMKQIISPYLMYGLIAIVVLLIVVLVVGRVKKRK